MDENDIEKDYNFCKGLAKFHEKRACDNTCSAEERDYHLKKMKYYDTLLEEKFKQISAVYKDHIKNIDT
jgi:hypothetical protein